jgi:hypothetical protein
VARKRPAVPDAAGAIASALSPCGETPQARRTDCARRSLTACFRFS